MKNPTPFPEEPVLETFRLPQTVPFVNPSPNTDGSKTKTKNTTTHSILWLRPRVVVEGKAMKVIALHMLLRGGRENQGLAMG